MATVIRFTRKGRRNRAFFRLGVFDVRTRRDGSPVEYLGHYDPLQEEEEKKIVFDDERVKYWLGQGARVSETVSSFLRKRGIETPQRKRRRSGRERKKS